MASEYPELMMAKDGSPEVLSKGGYIYEPKLDGIRTLCIYTPGEDLKIFNRKGVDTTFKYPDIAQGQDLGKKAMVLDGEIIVYDEEGNPDFHAVLRRDQTSILSTINRIKEELPAKLSVFDILSLDGKSCTSLPLHERKELLQKWLKPSSEVELVPWFKDGQGLWEVVQARNLEGIIAKEVDGEYHAGLRSSTWLKVKSRTSIDLVIVGYTSTSRDVSSIALGGYLPDGTMRFMGKVGTGFNAAMGKVLLAHFKKIPSPEPTIPNVEYYGPEIYWLLPKLVVEVQYLGIGTEGSLRQPSFIRLREDKSPEECKVEPFILQGESKKHLHKWRKK